MFDIYFYKRYNKVEIYFIKEKNHQKISGGLNSNWFMKQSIQLIGI